jgi:hypothetical protein
MTFIVPGMGKLTPAPEIVALQHLVWRKRTVRVIWDIQRKGIDIGNLGDVRNGSVYIYVINVLSSAC